MRDVVAPAAGTGPVPGALPASGRQWTIRAGEHVAVIVEVGGGVRTYEVGGRAVLAGYAAGEIAPGGAGQVLAPWPNRIRDGRYTFGGTSHQLPLSEPETHCAAHGLVRWLPWRRVAGTAESVTVETLLPAQPGYPWPLRLLTTWSVGPDGLSARHEATNLGTRPAPFGLGAHPYLTLPGRTVDELALTVPAALRLLADGRKLPIGAARVAGDPYDFTRSRPLAGVRLDTAFGEVSREADGRSTVWLSDATGWAAVREGGTGQRAPRRVRDAPGRPAVAVWADASFGWWQVYTGDTLPPERMRRSVAIEPMTCPPDAFRSHRDVTVLEPGQTWSGSWGVRAEPGGGDAGERVPRRDHGATGPAAGGAPAAPAER